MNTSVVHNRYIYYVCDELLHRKDWPEFFPYKRTEFDKLIDLYIEECRKHHSVHHNGFYPKHWYGEHNVIKTIEVLDERAHWLLVYCAIYQAVGKLARQMCIVMPSPSDYNFDFCVIDAVENILPGNSVKDCDHKIKNIILALNGREWFEEDDFYYSQECAFEYAFVRTSLISSLSIYASLKDHQFAYR